MARNVARVDVDAEPKGATYLTLLGNRNPEGLREFLTRSLRAQHGNVTKTASALDASRPFLWYWLRKLGMNEVPDQIRKETASRFRLPPVAELDKWLVRARIEHGEAR